MDHLEPCPLAGYRAAAHWDAMNRLWQATHAGTTTGGVKAACEALPNVLAGVMDPRCTASVGSALTSLLRLCGSQQAAVCMQEARSALASSLRVGRPPAYASGVTTPPTPARASVSSSASSSHAGGSSAWGHAKPLYPHLAYAQATASRIGVTTPAGQPAPAPEAGLARSGAAHASSWAAAARQPAARQGVAVASSSPAVPDFGFGAGTGWGMAPTIVQSPAACYSFAGVAQPATATLRSGRRSDTGRANASMEPAAAPASTARAPDGPSQTSDSPRFAFA